MPIAYSQTRIHVKPPTHEMGARAEYDIYIDTTELGVNDDAADDLTCSLLDDATQATIEATIAAVMSGDDAVIRLDGPAWGVQPGKTYSLDMDLEFGADVVQRRLTLIVV